MIIFSQWLWIIFLMFFVWGIYFWKKNPGVIDAAWSLAIMFCGVRFLLSTSFHTPQWIFVTLLIIWGVRLSGYILFTRVIPSHMDSRYTSLSEDWEINKSLGFLLNYQLQGLFALIIAFPFLFIRELSQIHYSSFFGAILIVVGFCGEVVADQQLQNFKRLIPNGVCNVGLWRYSRHPNYFFEWLIWLGFALVGLPAAYGWVGFASPALLLLIMLKLTGPITERQSLAKRGEAFAHYQKTTSMFVPLPPKTQF